MNTNAGPSEVGPSLLRMLVDAVVDESVYMLDPLGRVLSWNAAAERTMGYLPEDVIGRSVAMFYRPEDVVRGTPFYELAIAERRGFLAREDWRVGADGQRFRAAVMFRAIRNSAGELVGYARVSHRATVPITEPDDTVADDAELTTSAAVPAHESLRYRTAPVLSPHASLTALNAILNAVTENYFAVDDAWRLTAVGHGMERLVEMQASALLGQRLDDMLAASSRGAFLRDLPTRLGPARVSQHVARDAQAGESHLIVVTRGQVGLVVIWYDLAAGKDTALAKGIDIQLGAPLSPEA